MHFPGAGTATFRIRVLLTVNPGCAASMGLAKAEKGRKMGKQKITGKIVKHLMYVEKSFHTLVQS